MKSCIEELAIFGGKPLFTYGLHVGRPNIGDRAALRDRINHILDRRWLTNDGPCLQEFEKHICELLGVKHCVAVCNATIGLEILARAVGLSGEAIIPSFTFVALAHALQWLGIRPVFCDIDPVTHNLDPSRLEALITDRTTGIIAVHLWGRPCNVEALENIAQRHKLKLLFDAAHAFACSHNGRMIGNFGTAEVFSFHATKFINTFEGGAIVTNDGELAARFRLMRNFGFTGYDTVSSLGVNGKMNEVSAAMGLTLLESLKELLAVNYRNYSVYREHLARIPGVSLLRYNEAEKCNFQYAVVEIDETTTGISRDQLDAILWAENVLTRRYFYPGCHRMEPYRTTDPNAGQRLPQTEKLASRVLCLPTGSAMTADDIASVCQLIAFVVENARAVKERLSAHLIYRHHSSRYQFG